jgi:hypothetical protein
MRSLNDARRDSLWGFDRLALQRVGATVKRRKRRNALRIYARTIFAVLRVRPV